MVNGHGGPGAGAGNSGVADMVTISDIDEHVINRNLKIRYSANKIYVSIEIIQQYCFWHRYLKSHKRAIFVNFWLLNGCRCKLGRKHF